MASIDVAGLSNQGLVRTNNEDSFYLDPAGRLFVVADGLGGHVGGEVAAGLVTQAFAESVPATPSGENPASELRAILARADAAVRSAAHGDLVEMGATVVALCFDADRAVIAHAGDSRAYRLRADTLSRLTRDHTPEAEAGFHQTARRSSVITRAVGVGAQTEFDVGWTEVMPGDRYLLCSDGLTDMVPEPMIAQLLGRAAPPAALADDLVEAALAAGGRDNVTVVVLVIAS